MTPRLDGTLEDWASLSERFAGAALLCGNGLSINVWAGFAYTSLLEHAPRAALSEIDRSLFADTPNFERVLSDLSTAIRVNSSWGSTPGRSSSATATFSERSVTRSARSMFAVPRCRTSRCSRFARSLLGTP